MSQKVLQSILKTLGLSASSPAPKKKAAAKPARKATSRKAAKKSPKKTSRKRR